MIIVRRLFHEAEQATNGPTLCSRWLAILWSKGVVGLQLGEWSAGETDGDAELVRGPLQIHGDCRLRNEELEILELLARTEHTHLRRIEKLAALTRSSRRSRRERLQGDLGKLLSELQRHVEPTTADDFASQVAALLRRALQKTGGKIYGDDGAAALLRLRPTTLQSKLKKYGVKPRGGESA